MNVKLNSKTYEVEEGITLAAFIESLKLSPRGIAIAINYEVVPKVNWSQTVLFDGVELILVQAVSGG